MLTNYTLIFWIRALEFILPQTFYVKASSRLGQSNCKHTRRWFSIENEFTRFFWLVFTLALKAEAVHSGRQLKPPLNPFVLLAPKLLPAALRCFLSRSFPVHCRSCDFSHVTRSKDLFLLPALRKKKRNCSPIKADNVYYAVSLLGFLVRWLLLLNKQNEW